MKKLFLSLALPLGGTLLVQAGDAKAVIVNVGGTDYEIITITDTYANISANPLYGMPWFGDSSLATTFTGNTGTSTGSLQTVSIGGNDVEVGPIFAYSSTDGYVYEPSGPAVLPFTFAAGDTYAFAVVPNPPAATPGPLPLLGAAAAFSASRRLRHRISAQTFKL
jgi:hypothetical protein